MSTELATRADLGDMKVSTAYIAAFSSAVVKATEAVEAETAALRKGQHRELKAFEYRKSKMLLDLTRSHAALPANLVDEELEIRLKGLRAALADNMGLLKLHMQAVKEITDLLARSLLEADSDGTYSPRTRDFGDA